MKTNPPPRHLTGPNARALLHPSATIQKTLFARLESLDENEVLALAQILTPETAPVLLKVFPELAPIIQAAMQGRGQSQGGPGPAQSGAFDRFGTFPLDQA